MNLQVNLVTRRIEGGPSVDSALLAIASEPGAFGLDSVAPDARGGRFSIIGCRPVAEFRSDSPDWIERFRERVGEPRTAPPPAPLPFAAGWVGLISYEAGPMLERVASTKPHDLGLPCARFSLYDAAAVFDHRERTWTVIAQDIPDESTSPAAKRAERLVELLTTVPEADPIDWNRSAAGPVAPAMSRANYEKRLAAAKEHIRAGDIYQVNLTQRFTASVRATPMDIYRRLRVANPSAYGAFLTCGDATILCASPELFLDVRGRRVVTRPIKGTCPRIGDAVLDAARVGELGRSEKDHAELAMIIDLMRNDLGRVCAYGSVHVDSAADLETHPTVFHLVGTVSGDLREDRDWADLLHAAFPGGSITGCPKIRAMQIIDELETTERGVYCGSIGYVGLDGSLCLNIAIRTMLMRGDLIHLFGGSAIVADSDSAAEYDETLAKIAGLSRALRPSTLCGEGRARSA